MLEKHFEGLGTLLRALIKFRSKLSPTKAIFRDI